MDLNSAHIEQFYEDGVIVVEGLLRLEEIETLRKRAESVARGEHLGERHRQVEPAVTAGKVGADSYAASVRKLSHVAFADEVFEAHARNSRVLDCIEALLGPNLKLYQDQLFMKPPRIGSRQQYHQDQPLGFNIEPTTEMVTCWAALDDATIENGCLWMLPGTHKLGALGPDEFAEFEEQSTSGALSDERPIELKAGDCSFHHGHIFHSSRPNLTDQRRRGYATHYVSARCRYTGPPDQENDAILVRGRSFAECI